MPRIGWEKYALMGFVAFLIVVLVILANPEAAALVQCRLFGNILYCGV